MPLRECKRIAEGRCLSQVMAPVRSHWIRLGLAILAAEALPVLLLVFVVVVCSVWSGPAAGATIVHVAKPVNLYELTKVICRLTGRSAQRDMP